MAKGKYFRTEYHLKILRLNRAKNKNKGLDHYMYGKKHTEETKRKMSLAKIGKPSWNKGKSNTWSKAPKPMHGKENPAWKGGITPKDRLERLRFKKIMQKQIFERDDYTCQLCGIKGVDLQVDHIQSWAEYVELRFSMDNCRTLCAECHYKITFGKPMPKEIKGWGHNLMEGGRLP